MRVRRDPCMLTSAGGACENSVAFRSADLGQSLHLQEFGTEAQADCSQPLDAGSFPVAQKCLQSTTKTGEATSCTATLWYQRNLCSVK